MPAPKRPHPGGHLVVRHARPSRRRFASTGRTSTRWSRPTRRPPRRSRRCGRAPRATTRSSPAPSARRPAPRRRTWCDALLATGRPVVTVALRTPWDLAAYPEAGTHVCTYSILPESMAALAAALFGRTEPGTQAPFPGHLPVASRRGQPRGRRRRRRRVIDLQVNGAGGHDLTEAPERVWEVARDPAALRRDGVPADPRQPGVVDRRDRPVGARRRAAAGLRGRDAARLARRGPVPQPDARGRPRPGEPAGAVGRARRRLVARHRHPDGHARAGAAGRPRRRGGARRERRRRVRGPQRRDLGAGAGRLRRRHPERDPPVQRDGQARPPGAGSRRAPRSPTSG